MATQSFFLSTDRGKTQLESLSNLAWIITIKINYPSTNLLGSWSLYPIFILSNIIPQAYWCPTQKCKSQFGNQSYETCLESKPQFGIKITSSFWWTKFLLIFKGLLKFIHQYSFSWNPDPKLSTSLRSTNSNGNCNYDAIRSTNLNFESNLWASFQKLTYQFCEVLARLISNYIFLKVDTPKKFKRFNALTKFI